MDTKKIFVLIFVALFLALPSVSAWDWDNVKDYNPETKEISISSSFLWLFKTGEVARYQLTDNSYQCLRNCYAEGIAKIYEKGKLFSDMEFEGGYVSDYKIFIEVDEIYYETEYVKGKEKCAIANLTEVCHDTYIEKEVEKSRKVWQKYNGEELDGVYKWRLEGTKESKKVDWIGTAFGQKMEEWAWWDGDWDYKQPITSVNSSYLFINVTYDSDMMANFTDIRFLNADENTELDFWRESKVDSSSANFKVMNTLGDTTIYMYYSNAVATDNSDLDGMLFNSLIAHWNMDDASGTAMVDNFASYDGVTSGVTEGGEGKLTTGFDFPNNANVEVASFDTISGGAITWAFWMDGDAFTQNDRIIDGWTGTNQYLIRFGASDVVQTFVQGSGTISDDSAHDITGAGWHFYAMTYNSTDGLNVYIDNNAVENTAANGAMVEGDNSLDIGSENAGASYYDGDLDELIVWDRALTSEEVRNLSSLQNEGFVFGAETSSNDLAVTLNSPINWYNSTNKTITFNCSAVDETGVLNLTLLIDGDDNFTITNSSATQNLSLQTAINISDGFHNWTCRGDDGEDIDVASVRFLTIDSTSPSINIENPINQTYIYLSDSVNISLSENASLCWYELSESLGTNTSLTNRNDSVWSSISNISIISGSQYINVWCNDSFGNVNQSTRYYSGDSTPPSFTLNVPVQNEEFLKLETPYNITSNVSITDAAADVCWYYTSDNSTNVTYTCNGLFNVTFTTGGNKTMYLYANDTFSNENTTSVDFFVNLIAYTFTYENPTLEQIRQTITFEIFTNVINSFTATNYYNGTAANTTFLSSNSTYGIISSSVVSPEVTADSEVFFYTNYTINGVNQLSTIENHSVRNVDIDNCTSYDNAILNFTMVDEELQTELTNTTMEIAVNLYDMARTSVLLNISDSYSTNPTTICLNTNVTEEATYLMDVIVRYEETQHAIEYYNIVNFSLTNESELQDIILYDLNLTDSTEFQLTFIGSDYVAVEEALVYVDRQYIAENIFKTIELPKTDSNGQTILHLVRNDAVYNLRIVKNGVVLGNFENIIAFCEDATIGDCKISLNAFSSTDEVFDYDKDLGIIMSAATYNNATSIISFDFLTSDGSSKEVRMEVTKADTFGNRSVCNDTLTSSGGTISCNVGTYNGEASLRVSIFVDDNLASFQSIELEPTDYGVIGFLFFFILVACVILIFASTGKEGVLFGMVISMALGIGLGVIRGDMIGYGAAGLWIIIIAIIGIWKLNKEKAQ